MGLIDAYKAMKSIDEIVCSMSVCINSDYCHGMMAMKDAALHAIEEQPTVDAVPVEQIESFIDWLERNGYTLLKKAIINALHDYRADGERRTE